MIRRMAARLREGATAGESNAPRRAADSAIKCWISRSCSSVLAGSMLDFRADGGHARIHVSRAFFGVGFHFLCFSDALSDVFSASLKCSGNVLRDQVSKTRGQDQEIRPFPERGRLGGLGGFSGGECGA